MDDIDRKLLVLICTDPRMSLQGIAKKLGITKQSVHRRMGVLTKTGVIKGTKASISIPSLEAIPVAIFGKSRARMIDDALDRLGESEHTRGAVVAGGNYLYVTGLLRNISELDDYTKFVIRSADMPEPTVGIYEMNSELMPDYSVYGIRRRMERHRELSGLDLRIIASLKDDAGRPIVDIARMLGVSPKTVGRHLEEMIRGGSIDIGASVDSLLGGDMLVLVHVALKEYADEEEVGKRLLSRSQHLDQYIRTFSNLPRFLVWVFWSDNVTEIHETLRELGNEKDVLAITPNIGYLERTYEAWIDKLPLDGLRASQRARARKRPSGQRTW